MEALKNLADNWKCVVALIVGAATICGIAVTVDHRYASAASQKALQQQVYQMQQAQNYNNFQMRLDSLRAAYAGKSVPPAVQQQMNWLEAQIKLIEKQMGMGK
jgi:hypothetical protein